MKAIAPHIPAQLSVYLRSLRKPRHLTQAALGALVSFDAWFSERPSLGLVAAHAFAPWLDEW